MPKEKQTKLFDQEKARQEREKETLLLELSKKNPDLMLLKKANTYLFGLLSETEKEKIWKIIKDDIECLLHLIRPESNRGDVFPEKAFCFDTLNVIFTNGDSNIVEFFIRSQFYRRGMQNFLLSLKKNPRLITEKIGKKTYQKFLKEIK